MCPRIYTSFLPTAAHLGAAERVMSCRMDISRVRVARDGMSGTSKCRAGMVSHSDDCGDERGILSSADLHAGEIGTLARVPSEPQPAPIEKENGSSNRAAVSVENKGWQRPTLTIPCGITTIGPEGLNDRIRNGIGCDPLGIATSQ